MNTEPEVRPRPGGRSPRLRLDERQDVGRPAASQASGGRVAQRPVQGVGPKPPSYRFAIPLRVGFRPTRSVCRRYLARERAPRRPAGKRVPSRQLPWRSRRASTAATPRASPDPPGGDHGRRPRRRRRPPGTSDATSPRSRAGHGRLGLPTPARRSRRPRSAAAASRPGVEQLLTVCISSPLGVVDAFDVWGGVPPGQRHHAQPAPRAPRRGRAGA